MFHIARCPRAQISKEIFARIQIDTSDAPAGDGGNSSVATDQQAGENSGTESDVESSGIQESDDGEDHPPPCSMFSLTVLMVSTLIRMKGEGHCLWLSRKSTSLWPLSSKKIQTNVPFTRRGGAARTPDGRVLYADPRYSVTKCKTIQSQKACNPHTYPHKHR